MSAIVYSNIGRETGRTFDDTLLKVRNALSACKADTIGMGDIPTLAFMTHVLPHSVRGKVIDYVVDKLFRADRLSAAMTNMGVIDHGLLDFGDAEADDAYMVAPRPIRRGYRIMLLGVSGFRESLTLSMGFFGSGSDRLSIEKFMDKLVGELPGP